MTEETSQSNERRKGAQRRLINLGPPPGCGERRVNMERRLFSFGSDAGERRYGLEIKSFSRNDK